MLISTRGRYAIRVMIDIAQHSNGKYIAMKDIAERQGLSIKYMTKIMPGLTAAGLIEGIHGKGGGYRLIKSPQEYTIKEILNECNEEYAPVACLCNNADVCDRKDSCKTLPMWQEVYELLDNYFADKKLSDLL